MLCLSFCVCLGWGIGEFLYHKILSLCKHMLFLAIYLLLDQVFLGISVSTDAEVGRHYAKWKDMVQNRFFCIRVSRKHLRFY